MVSLLFCFLYWCFHKCGVNKSLLFQWMQCDCGKIPNWTLALSILCNAKKVDRTLTLMSVVCRSLVSLDDSCFVFSFWRFVALVILVMIDKASKFQKSFLTLWVSDGCQLWVKLQEISKKKKKKNGFLVHQQNLLVWNISAILASYCWSQDSDMFILTTFSFWNGNGPWGNPNTRPINGVTSSANSTGTGFVTPSLSTRVSLQPCSHYFHGLSRL